MVLLDVLAPLVHADPRLVALLLVPVVAIETVVVRCLTRIPWGKVVLAAFLANLATTLAGYPFGWVCMRAVRLLTGQNYYGRTPFHLPWDDVLNSAQHAESMGGAAWVVRPAADVRRPIRTANLFSYGLLGLLMIWQAVAVGRST